MTDSAAANAAKRSDPASDTEGAEKPVREQLKKTSIDATTVLASKDEQPTSTKLRGTPDKDSHTLSRKRSRDEEDDAEEVEAAAARHVRKRSRDSADSASFDSDAHEVGSATSGEPKSNGVERSRSGTPPLLATDKDVLSDAVASPKGKRTRAQFQRDEDTEPVEAEASLADKEGEPSTAPPDTFAADTAEPGAKRARELAREPGAASDEKPGPSAEDQPDPKQEDKEAESATKETKSHPPVEEKSAGSASKETQESLFGPKLASDSGFGNASSASPFASLQSKSALGKSVPPTKDSAKAGESNTSSAASPFGALGQAPASASPFASLAGQPQTTTSQPSAFGTLGSAPSGFAAIAPKSSASAFGSLTSTSSSSPFASALSGKSAFASSAAGGKPPILGLTSKPAKPFGAPQLDDREATRSDDEADATDVSRDIEQGISSPQSHDTKRDKRFVEQEVETGEENERTLFSSRGKLYYFDASDKSWKERGVGIFKCNITRNGSSAATTSTEGDSSDGSSQAATGNAEGDGAAAAAAVDRKARFIMRAEGSQRLILNSPFSKHTKFGDANGECPKTSTVLWHGVLDGHDKSVGLQLKMKADLITSLWEVVDAAKAQLP